VNSPLLNLVEGIAKKIEEKAVSAADGKTLLKRLIHGPVLATVVKLTPTPVDDLVLEFLKTALPQLPE
jgi:hypothetical protein